MPLTTQGFLSKTRSGNLFFVLPTEFGTQLYSKFWSLVCALLDMKYQGNA